MNFTELFDRPVHTLVRGMVWNSCLFQVMSLIDDAPWELIAVSVPHRVGNQVGDPLWTFVATEEMVHEFR